MIKDNTILQSYRFDLLYAAKVSDSKQFPKEGDAKLIKNKESGLYGWFARNNISKSGIIANRKLFDAITTELAQLPYAKYEREDGYYDAQALVFGEWDFSDPWYRGFMQFLVLDSKSPFFSTLYSAEPYGPLVPAFLYPFKLIHSVPYSKWYYPTLQKMIHPSLYEGMDPYLMIPDNYVEFLPEIREAYLRDDKNALTFFPAAGRKVGVDWFDVLPRYTKIMLTQVWAAHPSNRSKYIIFGPKDWDNPISLENIETATINRAENDPWLDSSIVLPVSENRNDVW